MRLHLTSSGRIVVALLVALSFVHWDCSALFNPPPYLLHDPTEDADPVQSDQNGNVPNQVLGCNTIPYNTGTNKTLPTTWNFAYSNGTENHVPILWPKGGVGTSPRPILLWDDPSNPNQSFNAIQLAAQSWQNALSANATGNLLVSLQISATNTDYYNANILAYGSSQAYLAQDHGGTVGGDQTYIQYASDWSTLVTSRVVINDTLSQSDAWTASLHEIGHALGLRHSLYQRSAMFPNGTPCIAYATFGFDYADMAWLESTYDPRWMTPKPTVTDPPCRKAPCPLSRTRQLAAATVQLPRSRPLPHPYIVPRGQRSGGAFNIYGRLRAPEKPSSILNHPRAHWVMAEDNADASTLSADSLWLASSLVAQVHIVRQVGNLVKGPLNTVYELATIERIFKHQDGPDSSLNNGDVILIADNQEASGDEFLDDQTVGPADGSTLVFLRTVGGQYNVAGRAMLIHGFTAPFVSKYALRQNASLRALSIRNTLLRQRYDGQFLTDILNDVLTGAPRIAHATLPSKRYNEGSAIGMLMRRNGIVTAQQVASYTRQLYRDPFALYRTRASSDAVRNSHFLRTAIPYMR